MGDRTARVTIFVRAFRAKVERIPGTKLYDLIADGEFDLPLDDVPDLLSDMLQISRRLSTRLNDMDVALEQVAVGIGYEALHTHAVTATRRFRIDERAILGARHQSGRRTIILKQRRHIDLERHCDTVQHPDRRVGVAVLQLRQKTFRTTRDFGNFLELLSEQHPVMPQARAERQTGPRGRTCVWQAHIFYVLAGQLRRRNLLISTVMIVRFYSR